MVTLLTKVKARLSIRARRRVRGLLEGEYTSIWHGRSIDFDDVRPYVPGDAVADVDWKATARVGAPMTRRYIASRKHTVLVVADTGRTMAALAESGERKSDLAIAVAGAVGYLATRHGDLVGLVAGDAESSVYRRPESTEAHLERVLQVMWSRTTLASADSDLEGSLAYVATSFRRRMILLVISDDRPTTVAEIAALRRLAVQHEILWVTVADADPTRSDWARDDVFDVSDGEGIPAILRSTRSVREHFARESRRQISDRQQMLDDMQIASARLTSSDDLMPCLYRLLTTHRSSSHRSSSRRSPAHPSAANPSAANPSAADLASSGLTAAQSVPDHVPAHPFPPRFPGLAP